MKAEIKAWLDVNLSGHEIDAIEYGIGLNRVSEIIEECMADIGPKWISANDKWPEEEAGILMAAKSGKIYSGKGCVFNRETKQRITGNGFVSDYYTHWMPLPKAPD